LLWAHQLVGHSQIPEPIKAFKARMHNNGAAIEAVLSVRIIQTSNSFKDDTAFDPTNWKISTK
jgi:hypothetical protein